MTVPENQDVAFQKKRALEATFLKKGVVWALLSAVTYGFYTTFVMVAQAKGVWEVWNETLESGSFLIVFLLPTIGQTLNDVCSAVCALMVTIKQGKARDLLCTLNSKAGYIMAGTGLMGGPIGGVVYVIALAQAGSIVVPIAALCPAIGTVISAIFYKQRLNLRVSIGVLTCVIASFMIGIQGLQSSEGPNMMLGLSLGLFAAFCWGVDGCVGGYSLSMIDPQIGITLRQTISALVELFVVVPILAVVGHCAFGTVISHITSAAGCFDSLIFFLVSGFFAYVSYASWYIGSSMCGTVLDMTLNGTFAFFAPFISWLVLGLVMGDKNYILDPGIWLWVIVMVLGIALISINPLDYFRKKENV